MCVSDDIVAACGTINYDYRSLYHHFENGCIMSNVKAVSDIRADFDNTLPVCNEVTEQYKAKQPGLTSFINQILRIFAPLL